MFTKLENPPGPSCLHVPASIPSERMLFGDRGILLYLWLLADSQLASIPRLLPQCFRESWRGSACRFVGSAAPYYRSRTTYFSLLFVSRPLPCPCSFVSPVFPEAWNRGASWTLWAQNECGPSASGESKTFSRSLDGHRAVTLLCLCVLVFRVLGAVCLWKEGCVQWSPCVL